MDPITLATTVSVASKACSTVVRMIQKGAEIEDCMGHLNRWYTACSDLNHLERENKNPSFWKRATTSQQSIEQEALNIALQKSKRESERKKLRELIMWAHPDGKQVWEDLVANERKIRQQRRETAHRALQRRRKLADIFTLGVGAIVIISMLSGTVWIISLGLK
nr:peptidase [uncultured Mediterranean phage uvMED]BAR29955.1 peptidase [uncultured Mediterranean phage uvMED]